MSGSMVGGVDASIPLQAGKGIQQFNPLDTLGKFAAVQNQLNQNRLFPGQLQIQGQTIQSNATSLVQQQRQAGYSTMVPLLNKKGLLTPGDATTALGGYSAAGGTAVPVLQELATGAPGDPVEYDQWLRAKILANSQTDAANATKNVTPQFGGFVNLGSGVQPYGITPPGTRNGGAPFPLGPVTPLGVSPEALIVQANRPATASDVEKLARVGISLNVGDTITENMAERLRQQGGVVTQSPGLSGGASPPAQSGAAPPQAAPPRLVPPTQPGAQPASAAPGGNSAAPAPPAASGKPVMTQFTPGTSQFWEQQAGDAGSAVRRATNFATDMFPLTQAQTALVNAPIGKGSEAAHYASSLINTFAPSFIQTALHYASLGTLMTPEQVKAYDEANKYLTQGQLGAPGATRSNEGAAIAGAATPSVTVSKEAAQEVLRGMIALRRMEQAGTLAWQQSGLPPNQYGAFMSNYATKADPRVFMFDQLTGEQRQKLRADLTQQGKWNQFAAQVSAAERSGVLSAPSAQ